MDPTVEAVPPPVCGEYHFRIAWYDEKGIRRERTVETVVENKAQLEKMRAKLLAEYGPSAEVMHIIGISRRGVTLYNIGDL